jgi:hypothetical protein
MPLEIRELHIRAVIDGGGGSKPASPGGAEQQPEGNKSEEPSDQLIDLCVEKVLEVLKDKQER